MRKEIGVFTPETAELILKKLGIKGGYSRQPPINPKRIPAQPQWHDKNAQIYRNGSGETIPPYACMKIVDANFSDISGDIVVAQKPDEKQGNFAFNGVHEVPPDAIANCYTGEVRCIFDPSVEEPAGGIHGLCGPKDDWTVTMDGLPVINVVASTNSTVPESVYEIAYGYTRSTLGDIFAVGLKLVGGNAGSAEAKCTFSYDIIHPAGDFILASDQDIGSSSSHSYRRHNLGKYSAADVGIANYGDGGVNVIFANEIPIVGTC